MAVSEGSNLWNEYILTTEGAEVDETSQRMAYRPTLIVGIGGTGCMIVQKLRKRVNAHFGQERSRAFRFVVLDTDTQRVNDDDELLGPDVFVNLAQPFVRASDLIQNMTTYPRLHRGLEQWWPKTLQGDPFPPADIVAGAQAVRAVGRLALWYQGTRVKQIIERHWGLAAELGTDYSGTVSRTPSGKVYVVCSLAGGTGSGLLLDLAYLIRTILKSRAAMPVFYTGILLTDATPFREFAPNTAVFSRMNANIYAALTELNHFMQLGSQNRTPYSFTYNGDELAVESRDKPFDVTYLVGVTNEHGHQLNDLNALCSMVAEGIFLEIASPLGATGRSVLDNVEQLSNSVTFPTGNEQLEVLPTAFSSFAVASLFYPRAKLAEVAAMSLVQELMERLSSSRGSILPGVQVVRIVSTMQEEIRRERNPIQVPPINVDLIDSELIRHQFRDLDRQLRPQAEQVQKDLAEALKRRLLTLVSRHCVENGLSDTLEMLLMLKDRYLEDAASSFDTMARSDRDEIEQSLRTLDGFCFEYRAESNKRRPNEEQLDNLRAQAQQSVVQLLQSKGKQVFAEQQASALRSAVFLVQSWLVALQETTEKWKSQEAERVKRALNDQMAYSVPNQYSLGLSALTDEGFESLKKRFRNDLCMDEPVAELIARWLESATRSSRERERSTLAASLFNELRSKVKTREEIANWDLFEAVLHLELKPQEPRATLDEAIDRSLTRLVEYGVPFWNFDSTLMSTSDTIAHINLLGYHVTQEQNGETARWARRASQLLGQTTSVRYNVRDRLVLLQTRHGAPAYVITASSLGLRAAYERSMKAWKEGRGRPVHLQHDWCLDLGLAPLDPRISTRRAQAENEREAVGPAVV